MYPRRADSWLQNCGSDETLVRMRGLESGKGLALLVVG
jgi:hypothetical protein